MEINITSLLSEDMFQFSHSAYEGGDNAGRNTWKAALDGPRPLLSTAEELQAFRDYLPDFGAWDAEEIAAMDDNELQALFLQFIAGDVRECPAIEGGRADSLDEIDWPAYEAEASAGRIPSNLCRADSGEVFYSLSH